MTLWGGLPDTNGWRTLDCEITLHVPPSGYDLDFTLDHGRVYLGSTKKPGPAKARVRFADQIWDLTLADDQTDVMIDVSRLFAGEPVTQNNKRESPRTDATLAVLQGQVDVAVDAKEFDLKAQPGPAELHWDNKAPGPIKPTELDTIPAAWAKAPAKTPCDRQLEMENAQKKLAQRIAEKGKSVELALAEIAQDTSRSAPSWPSSVKGHWACWRRSWTRWRTRSFPMPVRRRRRPWPNSMPVKRAPTSKSSSN